jgi:S-adenosylmethionine:tRNA ribosyltransferase-isomerase
MWVCGNMMMRQRVAPERRVAVTMRTDDLDFHLPAELIAQSPAADRAASRLLHYRRVDGAVKHHQFAELPSLLSRGDLLVFNDARVIPARFTLRKESGGRVEGLYVSQTTEGVWTVMLKNLGKLNRDQKLYFAEAPELAARVSAQLDDGQYRLQVESSDNALAILGRLGRMPLPPYIKRDKDRDPRDDADRERYQTVYANVSGSIAAPTAGLHFTGQLLQELDKAGVERTFVTLHVGLGTFKPVTAERLEEHVMHEESYTIGRDAAQVLNRAKAEARRIVAVGTTSARVLESQPADCPFEPTTASTSIFIYPPYQWKHVGALITNFHLPRSTLVALVAAMTGLDSQRWLYQLAVEQRYRFFSYGDAMFIE